MISSTIIMILTFLLLHLHINYIRGEYLSPNINYVEMDSPRMAKIYPGQSGTNPYDRLDWYRCVFLIMTFESEKETELIHNHFKSWIRRMPKGLDVVFVTDESDQRTYDEILPDANDVRCTIHLYKTPSANEGAQARAKTIDSLIYIYKKFHNTSKEYFFKIDPDTYVIPENLLHISQIIHMKTYPLPVDFGRVDCLTNGAACYSLGASYGLNKSGLASMVKTIAKQPELFKKVIREGGNNRMLDEDFFTSYLFRVATGFPTIHISGMSIRLQARNYLIQGPHEGEWDTTAKHVTIHLVKEPEHFDLLNKYYYFRGIALKKWYRLRK